jgi:MFS family permease
VPVSTRALADTILTDRLSGLLLAATLFPFAHGIFGSRGLGISFAIIFFIASSAASAAYLTVSEIFPLELRAFAIAIFYSLGTLIGGVGALILFGFLIATNSRLNVALGYGRSLDAGRCDLRKINRSRSRRQEPGVNFETSAKRLAAH